MEEEAVRWAITVSKETDLNLRTFLGAQGMKKGDLSKFIEEAVRWRVFNRIIPDSIYVLFFSAVGKGK
jgi:Ribbon-helix-helix domain